MDCWVRDGADEFSRPGLHRDDEWLVKVLSGSVRICRDDFENLPGSQGAEEAYRPQSWNILILISTSHSGSSISSAQAALQLSTRWLHRISTCANILCTRRLVLTHSLQTCTRLLLITMIMTITITLTISIASHSTFTIIIGAVPSRKATRDASQHFYRYSIAQAVITANMHLQTSLAAVNSGGSKGGMKVGGVKEISPNYNRDPLTHLAVPHLLSPLINEVAVEAIRVRSILSAAPHIIQSIDLCKD